MNDRKVRTEIQKWLDNTWDNFPPEFFITIHSEQFLVVSFNSFIV